MGSLKFDQDKVEAIIKGNQEADDTLEQIEIALDPHYAVRPKFLKARDKLIQAGEGDSDSPGRPWRTSDLVELNNTAYDNEVHKAVEELRNDVRGQIYMLESATSQMKEWKEVTNTEDSRSAAVTGSIELENTSFANAVGRSDISWDPQKGSTQFQSDEYIEAMKADKKEAEKAPDENPDENK